MMSNELRTRLQEHGHDHVLTLWERLDHAERTHLLNQLRSIDLAELKALYARRHQRDTLPTRERICPLPFPRMESAQHRSYRATGEQAFRRGAVAFLVVAGGQGTRLGFDDAKGLFPIGPISNKSLFQIHAEKILALRRRFHAAIPFLVMTSPATDAATRRYFAEHDCFGLPAEDVWFFCQGTMPALDLATGRLLVEAPGRLCLSPNGHGGTITGLHDSGLFEKLAARKIQTISYFQVDNPLTNLADFVFLGRHHAEQAEVSSKVMPKTGPKEKVGNFLLVDGRCSMIEYSDLPDEWAHETDETGGLKFWAGNPAIHLFDVAFLRKLTQHADRMPWHLARKKVPHINERGEYIVPEQENALKFERFIFDVLPQAERWTVLATSRAEEFAPVKNRDAEKVDTPSTCRQAISNLARNWLRQAGVTVAEGATVEISPLLALDVEELATKVEGMVHIERDTYLG